MIFEKEANRLIKPAAGATPDREGAAPNSEPDKPLDEAERSERSRQNQRRQSSDLSAALEAPLLAMLDDGESWAPQKTHDYVDGLRKLHRALRGTQGNE